MEILRRKILLENYVDRNYNSSTYGAITATSFFINVILEQTIDDMGIFTDTEFIPNISGNFIPADYSPLINKLGVSGLTFPFMYGIGVNSTPINDLNLRETGKTLSDYFYYTNNIVTGGTDSKKTDVRLYNQSEPFKIGFDINKETYINYLGNLIEGVDRLTELGVRSIYTFGTNKNDQNIGTLGQNSGILYTDLSGNEQNTIFSYSGEGWNQTNVSLSAITKEEYLFGVISKPEIKSDIFIDRGITTIFEKHLKLSEITNLDELSRYGKGFYSLIKQ
jgi:hypothetical protein